MAVELAEIFRQYGPAYRQKYASRIPATHLKAMRAIEQCRTEALGGQVYRCPNCEQVQYSYHSCRNRHCPKCQNENAQRWLEKQQDLLLPVPYFLLTFTLPASFNEVARSHQKLLYDLLFTTSAAATQQLAPEPRWLGGQVGMVGVLHTWGRNLAYHPHVHYLVPGGGWKDTEKRWVPAHNNFFLPVRALSRVFRGKLQQALRHTDCYSRIPANVWQQEWVVHCEGVGSGLHALKYLAPYIFRVALSNNRILTLEADRVTFRYRATDTGAEKRCTLGAQDFMHRFLQHVLPTGFVKVRYYGFFSATRRARLAALRQHLGQLTAPTPSAETHSETSQTPAPPKILCPQCGQPMLFQHTLAPILCRSP
ncbi:MAG: IS91 family transposase [Acidobacteria bacterium]|nr:IS91 family transposase [Acidobacteriota bacterium]